MIGEKSLFAQSHLSILISYCYCFHNLYPLLYSAIPIYPCVTRLYPHVTRALRVAEMTSSDYRKKWLSRYVTLYPLLKDSQHLLPSLLNQGRQSLSCALVSHVSLRSSPVCEMAFVSCSQCSNSPLSASEKMADCILSRIRGVTCLPLGPNPPRLTHALAALGGPAPCPV